MNRAYLNQLITEVRMMRRTNYTPESWSYLQDALLSAVQIRNDLESTQDDLDSAKLTLMYTIDDLVVDENSTTYNLTCSNPRRIYINPELRIRWDKDEALDMESSILTPVPYGNPSDFMYSLPGVNLPPNNTDWIQVHKFSLYANGSFTNKVIEVRVHPRDTYTVYREVTSFTSDTFDVSCNGGVINLFINFGPDDTNYPDPPPDDEYPLDAPEDVAIEGSVLSWTPVPDAISYDVYMNEMQLCKVHGDSMDLTTLFLEPELEYTFQVMANAE